MDLKKLAKIMGLSHKELSQFMWPGYTAPYHKFMASQRANDPLNTRQLMWCAAYLGVNHLDLMTEDWRKVIDGKPDPAARTFLRGADWIAFTEADMRTTRVLSTESTFSTSLSHDPDVRMYDLLTQIRVEVKTDSSRIVSDNKPYDHEKDKKAREAYNAEKGPNIREAKFPK